MRSINCWSKARTGRMTMDNQQSLTRESWSYRIVLQGATSTPRLPSSVAQGARVILGIVIPSYWINERSVPKSRWPQWITRIRTYVFIVVRPLAILFTWYCQMFLHSIGSNLMLIELPASIFTVFALYIPVFFVLCGVLWYLVTTAYCKSCYLLARTIYKLV
jgi:hypothetical protein